MTSSKLVGNLTTMQPIKFRAWHPKGADKHAQWGNKMTYWELGTGLDNSQFFNTAKAVMQYTGLKDRHGKEIYEGDIVRMKSTGARTVHEVKFRDGAFEVSLIPIRNAFVRTEPEVIGNIYEQPELIKAA